MRILIHLAVSGSNRLTARKIAESQQASFNHFAKIARWLTAEGYVTAARGRGGGIVLALPPEEISIGRLLRRSEAESALVECMRSDGGGCLLTSACGLMPILSEAQEAFFCALDDKTLADVIARTPALHDLVRALHARVA